MSIFTIGSVSGEHVSIELPRRVQSRDGWFNANIDIAVNGFTGSASPYFEVSDFVRFHASLTKLYETLSGKAELSPIEEQFMLEVLGNGRGAIDVKGCLYAQATYGSCLLFEFSIDQTYLPEPIRNLETFLRDNEAVGA